MMMKKVEQFFWTNKVWIFVVLMLMMSNAYVLTSISDGQRFMYLSIEKWASMLAHFGMLVSLFMPMLLVVAFDTKIKNWAGKGLWLLININFFVLHPFILGQSEYHRLFIDHPFPSEQFWLYGLFFLVIRLLLSWQGAAPFMKGLVERLKSTNLERLLLLTMSFVLVIATLFSQPSGLVEAIGNAFQYLIVFLLFYIFYLLNHYFLINKIFKNKGFLFYGAGFLGCSLLCFPVIVFTLSIFPVFAGWIVELDGSQWIPKGEGPPRFSVVKADRIWSLFLLTIPFIVLIQWFQQSAKIGLLERDKSEAELNLLKQQINPHFFFNTLNNLYALSLTKDKQTPEVILQLSELMRYVIYKGKEKEVQISEEVKYIKDYIKLQQIRLHQDFELTFNAEIQENQLRIPPLLFITLVENAFKHGIEPAELPCFLKIDLKSDENSIHFVCENSFEEEQQNKKGIGLENLKRRLALSFPNRYEFETQQKEEVFTAKLSIYLT